MSKTKYKVGDRVVMTNDAIENYGEKWRGVVLIVELTATSREEHQGYDEGVSPMALYDLSEEGSGHDLPFSLYDWEIEEAS